MGTASAPGKVILSGEHSVVYGKPAVAGAISLRCKATITDNSSDQLVIDARDLDRVFTYSPQQLSVLSDGGTIYEGYDSLAAAVLSYCPIEQSNFNIVISSNLPIGAGLGSSAASSVAIIGALFNHFDQDLDQQVISDLAYQAEKVAHGNPSGIDNSAASLGGLIHFEDGIITKIDLSEDIPLVIANTNVPRNTKQLVEGVGNRRDRFPQIMDGILDQMGATSNLVETALINGDLERAGELFDINQGLLEAIGVNHSKLEELISIAKDKGAYGAKLTGAGGGGCMVALVPDHKREEIAQELNQPGIDVYLTSLSKKGVSYE